jgi:hypothetical protein
VLEGRVHVVVVVERQHVRVLGAGGVFRVHL